MTFKRVFLLILDSLGVGETTDALNYSSVGANTLKHINEKEGLFVPNLEKIGFMNTINLEDNKDVEAYYTIAHPINEGIDSLSGHYEIMGVKNETPFDTFSNAFETDLLQKIAEITGRRIIGNVCCTNDRIIKDLGDSEKDFASLIIYTSGDSNMQIAAHEDAIPIQTLYEYAERIKEFLDHIKMNVSRVIARPFTGTNNTNYRFIKNAKKEFVTIPPNKTLLNDLIDNKLEVIGIGKVNDIFPKDQINKKIKALSNNEGVNKLLDIMDKDFKGLCLVNLSDFDELYGHNRDVEGYAKAIEEFDVNIPIILNKLNLDDLLIITADHGCDPTFEGYAHTRENVPVIAYSRNFKEPSRLEERNTLADIAATIRENYELEERELGTSFLDKLV